MGISLFVCSDHKGQAKNYKVPETANPTHGYTYTCAALLPRVRFPLRLYTGGTAAAIPGYST